MVLRYDGVDSGVPELDRARDKSEKCRSQVELARRQRDELMELLSQIVQKEVTGKNSNFEVYVEVL